MEDQKLETMQPQPEQEPAAQTEMPQAEAVAEEPAQQEPEAANSEAQSFYHDTGAGRTEAPFGASPYVTYHYPPQQPTYQAPQQPWQQPAYQQPKQPWQQPGAVQPQPKKKKDKKLPFKILAALLAIILIAVGCTVSVIVTNHHWKNQFALLSQRFEEQLAVLEGQIRDNTGGESGGQLTQPGQQLSASEIYEQNVNSVVAITATVTGTEYGQLYQGTSAGTGFIITADGFVVTNHHVIEGAQKITVTMFGGTEYAAKLIGSDATNDVALLKLQNATGLKPVTLGSSTAMQVGDQVVAIGNALGELSSTLTVGYVSGIDRNIATDGSIINMIQTDAAINSGNSGGPLFNAKGQVIGITTAKYSGTTSSGASIEGISFAIPMDDVLDMLEDLMEVGYIRTAYLGVMVRNMDPDVAAAYGLPMGVYVNEVTAGSCAETAGVRAKDIIIGLGGYEVENMNDLGRALRAYEPGETVTLTVWRGGAEVILSVTLDGKPQG